LTVLAAPGNIYEELKGKTTYFGVGDKLKSGAFLKLGCFGYFPKIYH